MSDDVPDLYDHDGPSRCEKCGGKIATDVDGDGVMTMSYEMCEDCGEDAGDPLGPVQVTEMLFAFARADGLME
jgi:hypothetical protein